MIWAASGLRVAMPSRTACREPARLTTSVLPEMPARPRDRAASVIPADSPDADFRMRYYNADGGEAEMCGNGARCFASFVHPLRRADAERVRFTTPAGLITAEYIGDEVRISLTPPTDARLNQRADFGWGEIEYHFIGPDSERGPRSGRVDRS